MEPLWRGLTTLGRSTDAAAQSAVEPSSGGSKNVWRVILRARGSLELKIEWRPGGTEGAYGSLCDKIRGATGNQSLPVGADAIDGFMGSVNYVELVRISNTYDKLNEEALPIAPSTLTGLEALRLSTDDILSEGTLSLFMHSSLLELDLPGQKLTEAKLEQLFAPLLSSPSLPSLPLSCLRIKRNLLSHLPVSILDRCSCLTELDASENRLVDVPSNLLQLCPALEVLNLESNRLTVPALDFRNCSLRTLQFGLNPLDYLPTLAPLTRLVELGICTLRISKNGPRRDPRRCFETMPVTAEMIKAGGSVRLLPWSAEAEKLLKPALGLLFKSSASIHPLLASLLALLGEDDKYRDLLGADKACLQHVLAMCQAPEPLSLDACVALSRLAESDAIATGLIEMLAVERLVATLGSASTPLRLYVLQTLRCFASAGDSVCEGMLCDQSSPGTGQSRYHLVTSEMLEMLVEESGEVGLRDSGAAGVKYRVLTLLGELAHAPRNRAALLADQKVMRRLRELSLGGETGEAVAGGSSIGIGSGSAGVADVDVSKSPKLRKGQSFRKGVQVATKGKEAGGAGVGGCVGGGGIQDDLHHEPEHEDVVRAARRVLAIIGDNEALTAAMGPPSFERPGHGVRVLSIDGGGVKGISAIKMLAELEQRLGRPLNQVFDLIVGTSAGAITAAALGGGKSCESCGVLYKLVVRKAFSVLQSEGGEGGHVANGQQAEEDPSGRGAVGGGGWWQKLVASGSSMKRVLMTGAKYDASPLMQALTEGFGEAEAESRMVESSLRPGACHVAIVAALCSTRPLRPFVFRTYQLPPRCDSSPPPLPGSCKHQWLEAMRASSAAPYFFEEFSCGGERYQDGAMIANNPAVIALHEAQRLWPNRRIDALVSVGTGKAPYERRDTKRTGGWGLIDTFGEYMVESAVSTDRVAEALEAFGPLMTHTQCFRLQLEDERCNLELDNTSAEALGGLATATDEYIAANQGLFKQVAEALGRKGGKGGLDGAAAGGSSAPGCGTGTLGAMMGYNSIVTKDDARAQLGEGVMMLQSGCAMDGCGEGVEGLHRWLRVRGVGIETVGDARRGMGSLEEMCDAVKCTRLGVVHVLSDAGVGQCTGGAVGEFVVGWEREAVVMSEGEARELLQRGRRIAVGDMRARGGEGMQVEKGGEGEGEEEGEQMMDVEEHGESQGQGGEGGGEVEEREEEGDSGEQEGEGCVGSIGELLSSLSTVGYISPHPLQRFIYSSCSGAAVCGKHVITFVFERWTAKTCAWHDLAASGCFRGKIVLMGGRMSVSEAMSIRKQGGAAAVVWCAHDPDTTVVQWEAFYDGLLEGLTPQNAASRMCNVHGQSILQCV